MKVHLEETAGAAKTHLAAAAIGRTHTKTLELVFNRVHLEDIALVQRTPDGATRGPLPFIPGFRF